MVIRISLLLGSFLFLAGCAGTQRFQEAPSRPLKGYLSDTSLRRQVASLDPEAISGSEVADTLSRCPAPKLVAFNGSAFNTMRPFARFLRRMGYPAVEVRSSFADAGSVAREIEETYEQTRLRPILIGHSQGGAFVVKVLHRIHTRCVSFCAAVAAGKWMRVLMGQWDVLPILRKIPPVAVEFAGYRLAGDWIGSDVPLVREAGDYEAMGEAVVRNVRLKGPGHLTVTSLETYADDPETRAWIDAWTPSSPEPADSRLLFAADVWYHVKKHWCLELQNLTDDVA